jgi:predicted ATPase/transcriptional regulator with XRE-family HTH domain
LGLLGTSVTEDGPGPFGELLRELRASAGLSQEELAERAGLSQRGISDLERGKRRVPHPATVRRLAGALGLSNAEQATLLNAARAPRSGALAGSGIGDDHDTRHNLPSPLSTFVGRVQETADVSSQLGGTRLLTLTGPPGVGKTRLALHLAEHEVEKYQDGAWLVELALVHEATLVPQMVAAIFHVHESPHEPLVTVLARRLRPLHLLLILDNCEHVLAACADLVHQLLRVCPHIVVLTTSREVLGLTGETIWRVAPLLVTPPDGALAPVDLARSEAASLFVERARAVQPSFLVTSENAPTLLEVCRRLEGIPLAIELAASRLGVLNLEQISERLATHLPSLSSKDPTIATHHRTLDSAIRWSYDLLTPEEQTLFELLSVFAGGWSLDAMLPLSVSDSSDDHLLTLLERLIDKSLVQVDTQPARPPRYRILEPLRQFGQNRLRERGEAHSSQERHAQIFLNLFEEAWKALVERGAPPVRMYPELDNLRTALRWLIGQRDIDRAQRLAGAYPILWFGWGFPAEGRRWLDEALALDPPARPQHKVATALEVADYAITQVKSPAKPDAHRQAVHAKLLLGMSMLAVHDIDLNVAEDAAHRSLKLYRQLGDDSGAAWPLMYLGRVAQLRADLANARSCLQEALAASRKSALGGKGLDVLASPVQSHLAEVAREEGSFSEAEVRAHEALQFATPLRIPSYICVASLILGELYYDMGRQEAARTLWEEALVCAREARQRQDYMIPLLINLSRFASEQGDTRAARALLAEGLMLADELNRWQLARAFEATASLAVGNVKPELVLQLAGTAAAVRAALGTPPWPSERTRLDEVLARARLSLTPAAAEDASTHGRRTPVDHAVALARDLLQL